MSKTYFDMGANQRSAEFDLELIEPDGSAYRVFNELVARCQTAQSKALPLTAKDLELARTGSRNIYADSAAQKGVK